MVFGCGTQLPPGQSRLNGATGILAGPVSVELEGVAKSTWNLNMSSDAKSLPKPIKKSGSPGAGGVLPSMSAGRTAPDVCETATLKQIVCSAPPISAASRLMAQKLRSTNPPLFTWSNSFPEK